MHLIYAEDTLKSFLIFEACMKCVEKKKYISSLICPFSEITNERNPVFKIPEAEYFNV